MSFLRKTAPSRKPAPVLALDLGASGAKCLLAAPEKPQSSRKADVSASFRVLSSSFAPYPSNSFVSGEIKVFSAVLAACRTVIAEALARADFADSDLKPKDIVVGFSGEFISLTPSSIRYRRPNPASPLSQEELDLLYKKIEKKSVDKHPGSALLDSRPLSLLIDGYSPLAPVGFKGEDLIVEYLTSFAPASLVADVKRLCSELGLYPLALASNAYALARAALGPNNDPDLSAILVDIGAATTSVLVIDSGSLLASTAFSIAGNNFTHQIAESSHISFANAEYNKLNLENDSALSDVAIGKTSAALDRAISVWLSAFSLALEDLADSLGSLPPAFIVVGGSAALLPLQETLTAFDWSSLPLFSRPSDSNTPPAPAPAFHYLSPTDFPGFSFASDLELSPAYAAALGLLRISSISPNLNSPNA